MFSYLPTVNVVEPLYLDIDCYRLPGFRPTIFLSSPQIISKKIFFRFVYCRHYQSCSSSNWTTQHINKSMKTSDSKRVLVTKTESANGWHRENLSFAPRLYSEYSIFDSHKTQLRDQKVVKKDRRGKFGSETGNIRKFLRICENSSLTLESQRLYQAQSLSHGSKMKENFSFL